MKFTRDGAIWTVLFIGGLAGALGGHFELLTKAFPSLGLVWQARIELVSFLTTALAGLLKMSPLALSPANSMASSESGRTVNPLDQPK